MYENYQHLPLAEFIDVMLMLSVFSCKKKENVSAKAETIKKKKKCSGGTKSKTYKYRKPLCISSRTVLGNP